MRTCLIAKRSRRQSHLHRGFRLFCPPWVLQNSFSDPKFFLVRQPWLLILRTGATLKIVSDMTDFGGISHWGIKALVVVNVTYSAIKPVILFHPPNMRSQSAWSSLPL